MTPCIRSAYITKRSEEMKLRWIQLLLVTVLWAVPLAGCENESSTPENITLIIKTPVQELNSISDPNIRSVSAFLEKAAFAFARQYEKARITPRVITFNYVNEAQAVTGSFGTDSAPDVLFGSFFNIASYIHTGRVVPLDDMITDTMRNDIESTAWKMGMFGGKTYMIPYVDMQNILIYNKKFFRECGLDAFIGTGTEIRNWTIEEWEHILDTLAARLPDGVYPLAIYGKNNQGDTHILSYIRAFGSEIFDAEGNFNFTDDKAVKALTWIRNGVQRGWYPPHPENLEMKDCSELFANSQLAIYMFNNANRALYSNLNHYGFVNYPGNIATTFINGFEVFDNGDNARAQAAKDFLKYLYETEEWLELSAGNIPVSKTVLAKYANRITMLNDFSANSVHVVDFMRNSPNWQGRDDSFRSVFWPNIHRLLAGTLTPEECARKLESACNAALASGRRNSTLHK